MDVGEVEDEAFTAGCSLCTGVHMDVGDLVDTGRASFELLQSLVGCRLEGLDHLTLMKIDGNGMVAVLHSLLCVAEMK